MTGIDQAVTLRAQLAEQLTASGALTDPAWREAVQTVPRHRFVPGFYVDTGSTKDGLPVWEPVTEASDRERWLKEVYSDTTLTTQFDGLDPDWNQPTRRAGGVPTSSSTLPSLVARMWADADLAHGHRVLEIGTGTGYSTALAAHVLGDDAVTSIEIDPARLDHAAAALHSCGYTPDLAVADGVHGYWPTAPFDRIVAACSVRTIPGAWLAQTRPGGKLLTTLGGWIHGYARTLLAIAADGTATGPLLPGTISFMPARSDAAPSPGNPHHWARMLTEPARAARHSPERITTATQSAFHARFLVQAVIPSAQLTRAEDDYYLVDVVTGSVAVLSSTDEGWKVREAGPIRLWERAENLLDAYDHAGQPSPETFSLHITAATQRLYHPQMPVLELSPTVLAMVSNGQEQTRTTGQGNAPV